MRMDRESLNRLRDELKRLLGLHPYDGPQNIQMGDTYFALTLTKKYGRTIEELRKLAGTLT